MRKLIVTTVAFATALSAISPVPGLAQTVATRAAPAATAIDPAVVATIKAFRSGGQALTDRIRVLVIQNNDLAADVARYLTSREVLSAPQREAVEKGLAEALNRLGITAQVAGVDPNMWLLILAGAGAAGLAAWCINSCSHSNNNPGIIIPPPVVSPH